MGGPAGGVGGGVCAWVEGSLVVLQAPLRVSVVVRRRQRRLDRESQGEGVDYQKWAPAPHPRGTRTAPNHGNRDAADA